MNFSCYESTLLTPSHPVDLSCFLPKGLVEHPKIAEPWTIIIEKLLDCNANVGCLRFAWNQRWPAKMEDAQFKIYHEACTVGRKIWTGYRVQPKTVQVFTLSTNTTRVIFLFFHENFQTSDQISFPGQVLKDWSMGSSTLSFYHNVTSKHWKIDFL
jgi:hypothetical protein